MILTKEELSTHLLPGNYMLGSTVRDGLQDILDRESQPLADFVEGWFEKKVNHLYFVGCGGSRAVLEPVKWLLDRFSNLPTDQLTGWEFVLRSPIRLNAQSAVVLGSHSGTTLEIIKAFRLARSRGASTLTFTQDNTPLKLEADYGMVYNSPATNLSKLLMNYMVAAEVIARSGDLSTAGELKSALKSLPDTLHTIKEQTEDLGKSLAIRYQNAKGFYMVATGPLYGLAYQFATCNLLEMQWKHASVYNAAEFPHGPLEIVEEGLPMIFLIGTDESREVALRAANFALRHHADAIILDLADLKEIHPWLAPFGLHLPLQWFISYMGIVRGHPIQTRRYMGKEDYYRS